MLPLGINRFSWGSVAADLMSSVAIGAPESNRSVDGTLGPSTPNLDEHIRCQVASGLEYYPGSCPFLQVNCLQED